MINSNTIYLRIIRDSINTALSIDDKECDIREFKIHMRLWRDWINKILIDSAESACSCGSKVGELHKKSCCMAEGIVEAKE